MKKIGFQTLGCRLNQYETDSLVTSFTKAGYDVVPFEEEADAYIINTCTVTNKSDRKSRNTVNKAKNRTENPVVVVTGCYVDSDREALEAAEGITYVVDNDRKSEIFSIVDAHFKGEFIQPTNLVGDRFAYNTAVDGFHTRGMIKIQDGCDNFCTFCIIPHVRGRAVSRPVDKILDNVKKAVAQGFKEVVITGVNISRYNYEGVSFEDLIEQILNLDLDFRLRISSMEPEMIGDKFYKLLNHPKMTPHLHLCLQSGSEKTLLKMRRQYTYQQYKDIVTKVRSTNDNFHITTDLIVGFPGESDEDFNETISAIREIGFGHVHTFPYSRRKNTRADRMIDQIPESVKKDRAEQIRNASEECKRIYGQSLIGQTERVLIEKVIDGMAQGYGQHYVPIQFPWDGSNNEFVNVNILGLSEGDDPHLIGATC
ncbi:tRNA (N(6)-L-threonylcarbamoyladenosine(37)-C(2))-methylthiotransferase MtaB [Spirochaeta cellobiosiphila]|uniref:tRNA (N(6)-L-threonylcarbamoyladenosine(37)-C(2))- methylthiotransferase MtaB n=1 Tax=Spirochaeta cellobiosiphila TaxID=504483 RepID=UPI000406C4D0|nr:tRNA (N(6)-L-threonylcarbamoyladenosine(37)-C(2))-methylthiotransferase MtaB [Spirochaeta cellobiosiphila]